jgi:membrane protein DedA with SNARE-associated domain
MQHFLQEFLNGASGWWAYLSVFTILVACGLGVPLPEDISLILGGFLAHRGAVDLTWMMAVGFTGILFGDSLIYLAGRRVGSRVGRSGGFWSRVVTPEKRARVEELFGSHGQKIVMIARFLPGVRAVTYFTAGSAHMPFWRFLFWDGVAALASAPLFVYLGFKFGSELETLVHRVKEGQLAIVGTLAAGALGYAIYRWRKNIALRRHLEQKRLHELDQPTVVSAAGVEEEANRRAAAGAS